MTGLCGPYGNAYPMDAEWKGKDLIFLPSAVDTSLENRMKRGVGKCGRCNVGSFYVCKEGPILTMAQLEHLPADHRSATQAPKGWRRHAGQCLRHPRV